jgi:phosphoribosylformylglycinamidine cyclo-ligase
MSTPPDDGEPAGAAAQHEHGSAYRLAGVDYTTLDAGKRLALGRALATSPFIAARGGTALDASRGEPAFVFELDGRHFAFVVEGLGTKSIIARQVAEALGVNRFADVAYDTVAAIVNDLCCVGALPLVVNAYFATGSADWYRREDWQAELLEGWYRACADAGATWGGGESPSLPELVDARDIELAGSAIGALPAGAEPILGAALAPGDEIVIVASSGLHANGSSLARLVATRLPDGYATPLRSGRRFGEALLDPSVLYARLVERLATERLPITYLSHITGHGLLKLMRPVRELTYEISALPPVPEVFDLLVGDAEMSPAAAYSTFNMGCGFAVYCRAGAGEAVVVAARQTGYDALLAGEVRAGPRRVVLEPVAVTYDSGALQLAPGA